MVLLIRWLAGGLSDKWKGNRIPNNEKNINAQNLQLVKGMPIQFYCQHCISKMLILQGLIHVATALAWILKFFSQC